MTHKLLLLIIPLCLLAVCCAAETGSLSITRMGNGLTVILEEDHATDLVGVDVWVKAGSGSETIANNGVSHLIEHLVFGATAKREPGDMDLEMESLGATLDAHTSRDWSHFNTTVSSRYLPKALDVLADAVTGAAFREEDLGRERLIILDEIAKKEANPIAVCKDYLAKELYGKHPYSLPIEGTRESLIKITRQDILDHYHKFYVPSNIAIVLVGDIDAQRAVAEIGRAFQGFPSAPLPEVKPEEIAPPAKQITKAIKGHFKLNYLAIGFLGPKGADYEDVCATDVMLTYLGFGYRSWMEDELQKRMGLAVDVSADFLTQKEQGMISLIAAATDSNIDKARGAIFARIASLGSEGIPENDIALAKRSLLGQFAFQKETYGGRANSIGFYYAAFEPEFDTKYITCVQAVMNKDIIRAARRYLDPDRAVVLTVGSALGGQQ